MGPYHEDHIPDGGHPLSMHKLLQDFPSRQIPFDAHGASRTEGAAHDAAHLGGDAERGSLMTSCMRSARCGGNVI